MGGDVRKDFYYWLIGAKDPETGKGYTLPELWAEALLLIAAGSDTSSVTMAATFFYFARHPKCLAKLQKELQATFSSVDDIRMGPQLNSCQYLRAVIDEGLRMAGPVPSDLPREVLPGGIEIDGQHYPAGTIVGTSMYCIHHNEEYFPDPWSYKPERWIIDQENGSVTAESVAIAKHAFCPFSLGSRACIGRPMALAEISIALGRVFYLYDIKLRDGDVTGAGKPELGWGRRRKGEYQLKDHFASDRDGPIVQFKAHNSTATAA